MCNLRANWAPPLECFKRQSHNCTAAGFGPFVLSTNYSDLKPLNGTRSRCSLPQQCVPHFVQRSLINTWTEDVAIGSVSPLVPMSFIWVLGQTTVGVQVLMVVETDKVIYGAFPLHGTARYGTVRYGSLLGGFPLGTVPGTWYFFSTTSVEVPSSRTVTKTWRVNSADHWMAGENRHYCVTELATRDPPLPLYPLDLNQHSQRRIGRNFCLNKRTFLHQPQNSSVVVCWGSSDVPLVDGRGADPARAWWRDAEGKALCITLHLNLLYFQSMFSVYIFTSVSVFCFN